MPSQTLQDFVLHRFHLLQSKGTTGESKDRIHGRLGVWNEEMLVLVELDGDVEACHGQQLEHVLVHFFLASVQESIQVVHGNADHFTRKVEMIDDCVLCNKNDRTAIGKHSV